MNVTCIVGTRPNIVKLGPVYRALVARGIKPRIVHTGQHSSADMSDSFFKTFALPEPDENFEIQAPTDTEQVSVMLMALECEYRTHRPDVVVVFGDVNSTLAGALAAAQVNIPVAHVEAGLRSGDRWTREELNRILTDRISDICFATDDFAQWNLSREGVQDSRNQVVGNVMVDALRAYFPDDGIRNTKTGVLVTLHRAETVDDPDRLAAVLTALAAIEGVIFPVHPRTAKRIKEYGLEGLLTRVDVRGPMEYTEFLQAVRGARILLTDSGGAQVEAVVLGIPCIVLRDKTEHQAIADSLYIAGTTTAGILKAVNEVKPGRAELPALWDGHAAERIADELIQWNQTRGNV